MGTAAFFDLKEIADSRGAIVVGEHLPFAVRRFFFLNSDVRGIKRGGHAHRTLHQMLLCVRGMIIADADGTKLTLRGGKALHVPPMVWLDLFLYPRSSCLVLASEEYDESDYIRDRAQFDAAA